MAYRGKGKSKPKSNFSRRANPSMVEKDKIDDKKSIKPKYNDPSWYIREGQLAKDVASYSFNNALGAKVYINTDNTNGSWNPTSFPYTLPGIMSLEYIPALGISTGPTSPVNIAAKNLYSFIRHANSGSKNYDSPDLMLYVIAMDSIYNIIIHMQRAYGAAKMFSQTNRYIGDALLQAMGFDPNDVRTNLAGFRALINMLIVKANSFCVPNTMTLFQRHAWMNKMVFADSGISKCQMYLYRPIGLHKYIETDGPGHCVLKYAASAPSRSNDWLETDTWTVTRWYLLATELLGAVIASEDINIMSGDILKAYGRENLFTLAMVPDDYSLEFGYSEEILDQIHNTNFSGRRLRTVTDITNTDQVTTLNPTSWSIIQDPSIGSGNLLFAPQVALNRSLGINKILDMYDQEPTPERVLVATRNMLAGSVALAPNDWTVGTITDCGSDICMNAVVYDHQIGADGNWVLRATPYFDGDPVASEVIPSWSDYAAFHRAPIGYLFSETPSQGLTDIVGEIDNFTVITNADIAKLHQSALLSMLGVPV